MYLSPIMTECLRFYAKQPGWQDARFHKASRKGLVLRGLLKVNEDASQYRITEQGVLAATLLPSERKGYLHIFVGHRAGKRQDDESCLYCSAKPAIGAYTYFGAFVCGECWDNRWRETDDGECDPPFAKITHQESGYTVFS